MNKVIFTINNKLTRGGLVNSYKITNYKNKDYEKTSFNTRIFS